MVFMAQKWKNINFKKIYKIMGTNDKDEDNLLLMMQIIANVNKDDKSSFDNEW